MYVYEDGRFSAVGAADGLSALRIRTLFEDRQGRTVSFDALQRTGVGVSRLGTSHAIAIGAYAHALTHLPR